MEDQIRLRKYGRAPSPPGPCARFAVLRFHSLPRGEFPNRDLVVRLPRF